MTTTATETRSTPTPTAQANQASVELKGRTVTRAQVLEAISECDALGKAAFLERHGYRDSVTYHLRHDGRSYPSKAILGVAAGLTWRQHSGGAAHTVRLLNGLGFHVRNSKTGELVDRLGLDALRAEMLKDGWVDPLAAWGELPIQPSAYFLSGSNRPAQIAVCGKLGADVGVAAPEVSEAAEAELHALAGSDVPAFVDSGAFSEVSMQTACESSPTGEHRFPSKGGKAKRCKVCGTRQQDAGCWPPRVVKPITDADWQDILGLYRRLAVTLGPQLFCVAPDQVGSQEVTLARLERYADEVRELHELGARVLVCVQKGALSQVAFAAEIDRVLGFTDWTPALPCKKAATTADEVREFVQGRDCEHVHLLGLGIRNRGVKRFLAPFAEKPTTTVSLDSCWVRASTGKTNGPKGGPRILTKARDLAEHTLRRLGRFCERVWIELAWFACLAAPAPLGAALDSHADLFASLVA